MSFLDDITKMIQTGPMHDAMARAARLPPGPIGSVAISEHTLMSLYGGREEMADYIRAVLVRAGIARIDGVYQSTDTYQRIIYGPLTPEAARRYEEEQRAAQEPPAEAFDGPKRCIKLSRRG